MSILQDLGTSEAQYDEYVKRILSNRYILSWILKYATEEFNKLSIRQIAEECIAEDISVLKVRVMPGQTNAGAEKEEKILEGRGKQERILGANTEDKVPGEGEIYYDIRFSAYAPDKEEVIKILLNVEAQKKFKLKYALVTRGVFYAARMISAQMNTEFSAKDYSGMKKVYSIWICMNAPNYIGNAIAEYSIKKQDIIKGIPDIKEDYDKLSVVMICLNGTKAGREKGEGLVGMLNTLLAEDMGVEEKGKRLSEDYDIEIDDNLGEVMGHMCNLGEGIREDALEEGMEKGETRKLVEQICKKLRKGKTLDIIAEELEEEIEKIRYICEVAAEFAPNYECDKVYEAWEEESRRK